MAESGATAEQRVVRRGIVAGDRTLHELPFQRSIKAWPSGVVPTAQASVEESAATPKSCPEPEGDCSVHDDPFHISIRGWSPDMPTWVPTAQTCVASAAATPWNSLPSVPGFGEVIVLHPDPSRCAARVWFPDVPGRDPTAHTSSEPIAATLRRVEWSPAPRLSTMLHPVAVAARLAVDPTRMAR